MRTLKKFGLAAIILLVALSAAGLGWYVATDQKSDTASAPPESTEAAPSISQMKPRETEPTPRVMIYFSKHPESDDDPGQTFPVSRTAPDLSVATFAVSELLKGPTMSETDRGYFSNVELRAGNSSCGGKDFQISFQDKVAKLQFCKPFDHIGSVSDGQAESSIKATLLQFDTVDRVIILNQAGDCEFDMAGDNRCLE